MRWHRNIVLHLIYEVDLDNYVYVHVHAHVRTCTCVDAVDNEESSGAAMEDESSGEVSSQSGGKKQKKEKRKFDISLPAQHLVSKSKSPNVNFEIFMQVIYYFVQSLW